MVVEALSVGSLRGKAVRMLRDMLTEAESALSTLSVEVWILRRLPVKAEQTMRKIPLETGKGSLCLFREQHKIQQYRCRR